MEQRIKALEEEVKLLKNEIKSVLLDIKESLAGGEWVMAGQPDAGQTREAATAEEIVMKKEPEAAGIIAGKEVPSPAGRAEKEGKMYADLRVEAEKAHIYDLMEERRDLQATNSKLTGGRETGEKKNEGLDVLTLMRIIGWLEKSRQEIGRNETEKLVKVYADSDKVPKKEGEALRLVNGIWGSEENGTLLNSLMELDKIMRQQGDSRNLQSILVKMISDPGRGQENLKIDRERMERTANG